jgi:glycosyltransferase involved in cell wall biosynthesis
MRILVAADGSAADLEVYAALVELGADVQVVVGDDAAAAPSEGGGAPALEALAGRVHVTPAPRLGRHGLHRHRSSPVRWIRQLGPDVVVSAHDASVASIRWVRAARRARVPIALTTWVGDAPPGRIVRLLQRRALRTVDGVVARTPSAARHARRAGARGPIRLVPPAVAGHPVTRVAPPDRWFTVGYVGSLAGADGIDDVLAAVNRLPRETRLLVAGDGQVRAEVASHKKVDLRTGVPRGDLPALYGDMDVLVVPFPRAGADRELLGPVLLGAMATGTPVIGASTGDIPWVLAEACSGMTYRAGDVPALATLLMDARTDPDRWAASGQRARATVAARFSPAASASALLELAEELAPPQ